MTAGSRVSLGSAALVGAGLMFMYAGVKGYSIPATIQDVITGKNPLKQAQAHPISGSGSAGGTGPVSATGGNPAGGTNLQNQALGRLMAAAYGWATGAEWTALNNIAMAESGWSDTVINPGSGAAGIAQKIDGWSSDYQEGNARQQITWFLKYIKQRYGDPAAAWQFHLANNWY